MTLSRRRLAVLTSLLVALGLVCASPDTASAGTPVGYWSVRHLDAEDWSVRSLDCDLAPSPGATLRLERLDDARQGAGALLVTSGTDRVAGVLRRGSGGMSARVEETVRARGSAPTGRWLFESRGHVLTSDPVPLRPNGWTRVELARATLHEGDWTGTLETFQEEFGTRAWAAGLLTGDCLGSPAVHVDTLTNGRNHKADFEPPLWLDIEVEGPEAETWDTYDRPYGARTPLVGRMIDVDPAGVEVPQVGKRLELWRRPAGSARWTRVLRATTDDAGEVRTRRRVTEAARYEWRRPGGELRSTAVLIRPRVAIVARLVGPGVTRRGEEWRVPAGRRLTLVGRIWPSYSPVDVELFDYFPERVVRPDRHGRFGVLLPALRPGSADVYLEAQPRGIEHHATLVSMVITRRP